uniref:Uncharacterized protein n=1 Tax=Arundo donax TaxID=35708 RepID=A0A0A9FCN9_ARUDO
MSTLISSRPAVYVYIFFVWSSLCQFQAFFTSPWESFQLA